MSGADRGVLNALNQILNEVRVKGDICWMECCDERRALERACALCGYSGRFLVLACACYDAGLCSPKNPGAGCPHGGLECPVCGDGQEDVDAWALVRELRAALSAPRTDAGRACEKCGGAGPTLYDLEQQRYLCRSCHSDPQDAFFALRESAPRGRL